jgi:hypothetical protein
MAIFDAGISTYAGVQSSAVTVETFLYDNQIRSLSKRGKIQWPMEPDFVIILRYGDDRMVLMGEVDRGSEDVESTKKNSLSTKAENYKHYYTALRKTDPWLKDFPQPQTMFIFDSQRRLENAKAMIARCGGRSSYWFALSAHLEPPYSLSGEVWQRIGLDGYYSPLSLFTS